MSRELKFRVWDVDNNRMFNDCFELIKTGFREWVQLHQSSDNLEWQQYTGKKDDDGIDIYEDDIITNTVIKKQFVVPKTKGINSYYRNMPITTKAVVRWDSHWARWIFTNKIEIGKLKVIGNTHQNLDLL